MSKLRLFLVVLPILKMLLFSFPLHMMTHHYNNWLLSTLQKREAKGLIKPDIVIRKGNEGERSQTTCPREVRFEK